jgi:hypothetical protein
MITLDQSRHGHLYQKWLRENPERTDYYFNLPNSTFMIQYHATKKEIVSATFDSVERNGCSVFRYFGQKVELN